MRLMLALLVTAVAVVSADADIRGRRAGGNRIMPIRNGRLYSGYNKPFPGYDSSYYSPYSVSNSSTVTAPEGASARILQPTPATAAEGIPAFQPQPFPQSVESGPATGSNSTPSVSERASTRGTPLPTRSIRKDVPTNYQLKNQGNTYWESLAD